MKWAEFLDTGKRLLVGSTEGDWRSAASRSYYAVFHFFRDWLRNERLDLGAGGQAHNSLYVGFANCRVASVQTVGDRIDELRRARTHADYDLRRPFAKAKSVSNVREADSIVADFQSLLVSIPANTIVDGVKNYLISIGRLPRTP
jgi:uncharacterized protein (UPF0332 family)